MNRFFNFPCRFILFLLLVSINQQFISAQEFAQQWIFVGFSLKFNNDSVNVSLNNVPNEHSTGCASICDSTGRLVLYTNGLKVWNENDELIENGDSLLIPGSEGTSLLPSLIIPAPGYVDQYYIFTLNPYNGNEASGLYYAIADMSGNNGHGRILQKQIRLTDSTSNKITALYHANRNDVWVITHKYATNSYYAYRVNAGGVSETPVISVLGKINSSSFEGQLKGSPDGKKVAVSYDTWNMGEGFDLFDFNDETGKLSNARIFKLPDRGCNGLEFSSDATKLYVYQYGSTGESGLFQFDISSNIYDSINASRKLVLQDMMNGLEQMQLGPNGSIYISKGGGSYDGALYFATIKKPNEDAQSCEAIERGLYLNGGFGGSVLFPNYIQNYFFKTSFDAKGFCFGDITTFKISNISRIDSVLWSFGDNTFSKLLTPAHRYDNSGNFLTRLVAYYSDKSDTIYRQITINPIPSISLGNDTTVCSGYVFRISGKYESINWHNGSNAKYYSALNSGKYWVHVKNHFNCEHSDTIDVLVNPSPIVNIGNDTLICDNISLILKVNSENAASDLLWNDGSKESTMLAKGEGVYWIRVTNEFNCSTKDFINITTKPSPIVNLGRDTTINGFSILTLDAGDFDYPTDYKWNSNSNYRYNTLSGTYLSPGSHTFSVAVKTSNNCIGYDTVTINLIHNFRAYNACLGKTTTFALGSENFVDSIFWDFGDGNYSHLLRASHQYADPGQYNATAVIYTEQERDTLHKLIKIVSFQAVNLGEDMIIGYNSLLTLDAGSYDIPVIYRWENYSTDQTRYILGSELEPGTHTFFVLVSSDVNYCASSDTIRITRENVTETDIKEKELISLYPNPVKDILYIENPETDDLNATLKNSAGLLVETWNLVKGLNEFYIGDMKPGLYILQLSGNIKSEFKIIKL